MTASLLPLLWPILFVEYALDVVEVTVLIRLGPNMLEAAEKLEAVEVTDDCR